MNDNISNMQISSELSEIRDNAGPDIYVRPNLNQDFSSFERKQSFLKTMRGESDMFIPRCMNGNSFS